MSSAASSSVILSVFWCGTAGSIANRSTQISSFFRQCNAKDLTGMMDFRRDVQTDHDTHYKVAIDGVGVTHGTPGMIWACGLSGQAAAVAKLIRRFSESNLNVTVNCLGLSRGACGVMLLCKRIGKLKRVRVNALLFDPVPGNLVLTGTMNCFTLASQCINLSRCTNLSRVLALYPYEPLPDLAFHAPLIGKYPKNCIVEEDVTLGCHQGALFPTRVGGFDCALSYVRILRFLTDCGTVFVHTGIDLDVEETRVLEILDQWTERHGVFRGSLKNRFVEEEKKMDSSVAAELMIPPPKSIVESKRQAHSPDGCGRCLITRHRYQQIDTECNAWNLYLNRHHRQLKEFSRLRSGKNRSVDVRHAVSDGNSLYLLRIERDHYFVLPEPCCFFCWVFILIIVVIIVLAAVGIF